MEGSSNIFQTMQSLMALKTKELAKKRDNCKSLREQLTQPLERENDPRQRVKLLIGDAGTKPSPEHAKIRRKDLATLKQKKGTTQHGEILELAGLSAHNIQRLLDQSMLDNTIPPALFTSIEERFVSALTAKEIKYKFATLFTALVNDASPGRSGAKPSDEEEPTSTTPSEFETVGRSAMHEQRETWESQVFTPHVLDEEKITKTLEQLFGSKSARQSIYDLRKMMALSCRSLLLPDNISNSVVKSCIKGLISSDLLSQDQNDVLKEIQDKEDYLTELSDVLKLRLTDIETWSWNTDAIPVEMRRQLNGKYRFFIHEEVTQALFIYYIGKHFATVFLDRFNFFFVSKSWKKQDELDSDESRIYSHNVGHRSQPGSSIKEQLQNKFVEDYFMSILPASMEEEEGDYSAEDASNNEKSTGQKSVDAKQSILHLMKTEALLADKAEQSLHVLQTDFRWFGPSLSHSAIFATLKFFGVTDVWLRFFEKFLKAPLRFVQDGPNAQVRIRECGVPMSHILSTVFGEVVLFCTDFAVNEATKGRPMFRLHDDIWIWGSRKQCANAWKALMDLTSVLGIKINEEKTGSACLTDKDYDDKDDDDDEEEEAEAADSRLPSGNLKWGFLEIRDGGDVCVNEESVTTHIAEFRRQLEAQGSIMSWVRAYNAYCRFISFNLCRPANSLGREHLECSLAVFARVHKELFPATNGSVAEHIKAMIADKYGVTDVPDGFIYLPMTLGGLEVHNPCIALMNMRANVDPAPEMIVREALEDDEHEYERLRDEFKRLGPAERNRDKPSKDFFSYEEYSAFRRYRNPILGAAYQSLVQPAAEEQLEPRADITKLMEQLPPGREYAQYRTWDCLTPYWQVVFDLYGTQMAEQFGGLEVVGRNLLPLGMVKLLKGKVRWES